MWSQDAVTAGGRKSEYGRNQRVLEFPGPGRAALPAGRVRAPLARPRALGTLRSPCTAAPGVARMWCLSQGVVQEQVGPDSQKWLQDYEGKERTVCWRLFSGSWRGLPSLVCPWGRSEPSLIRELEAGTSAPGAPRLLWPRACFFRHGNRMIRLGGGPAGLSRVSCAAQSG